MDVSRLVKLERDMAQLKSELRSLRSPSGYGSRRQPRVGLTTSNYNTVPSYPVAPTPSRIDPVTGETIPGTPHANTFPFVFVDAQYDPVAGIQTPTSESRQWTSALHGNGGYFRHVHNLSNVYIPQQTLIEVFEDNGYYWTNWNETKVATQGAPAGDGYMACACLEVNSFNKTLSSGSRTAEIRQIEGILPDSESLASVGLEWIEADHELRVVGDEPIDVFIVASANTKASSSASYDTHGWYTAQFTIQGYLDSDPADQAGRNTVLLQPTWFNNYSSYAPSSYKVYASNSRYRQMLPDAFYHFEFSTDHPDALNGLITTNAMEILIFRKIEGAPVSSDTTTSG